MGKVRMPWLLVLALLGGCPGELQDPERFGVAPRPDSGSDSGGQDGAPTDSGGDAGSAECGDTLNELVKARCGGTSACHGSGTGTAFNVDAADLAASLVDIETPRCEGEVLVDSNDVSNSFVLKVLAPGAPCGVSQMPVGGALSAEETACFAQWLQSLAGGGS